MLCYTNTHSLSNLPKMAAAAHLASRRITIYGHHNLSSSRTDVITPKHDYVIHVKHRQN